MHVVGIDKRFLPAGVWNMDCGHICVLDRESFFLIAELLDSSHCNHHIGQVQSEIRKLHESRQFHKYPQQRKSSKYLTHILAAILSAFAV